MIVKQIRISNESKEKLSRLKGKTGIKNWNVLCRWALCYSLQEGTVPNDERKIKAVESNVEMSWYTFGGEYSDVYEAVMIAWCKKHGLPTDNDTVAKYFKLNLERGISYLSGNNVIKSLDDLLALSDR